MRIEPLQSQHDARAKAIDIPLTDSVALRRLIDEVRQEGAQPPGDTTLYNRTYHRHNR